MESIGARTAPARLPAACAASTPKPRRPPHKSSLVVARATACAPIELAQRDGVSLKYSGLTVPKLQQAFRAENPGLLEALACVHITPSTAAKLLIHLEAELPPALTDVAASGDCVLVAVAPGLLPLLGRATDCCEASLAAGQLEEATATSKALLSFLCRLRFGTRRTAAGYDALATRCKQALKSAYDAGAPIRQEDVVELYTACSRSSPFLFLTPYFGHGCACTVDGFISRGWASGELAVRFAEAYCALVGRGRYTQVQSKFVRLVHAALEHTLSAGQLRRLLAAERLLPVELSLALDVQARSHPECCWHAPVVERLRLQEAAAAALPALRNGSVAAGCAAWPSVAVQGA